MRRLQESPRGSKEVRQRAMALGVLFDRRRARRLVTGALRPL